MGCPSMEGREMRPGRSTLEPDGASLVLWSLEVQKMCCRIYAVKVQLMRSRLI